MTGTQADLTERARLISDVRDWHRIARKRNEQMSVGFDTIEALLAEIDALQSEREAAAAEARRAAIEECKTCVDPNQTAQEQYDAMDAALASPAPQEEETR